MSNEVGEFEMIDGFLKGVEKRSYLGVRGSNIPDIESTVHYLLNHFEIDSKRRISLESHKNWLNSQSGLEPYPLKMIEIKVIKDRSKQSVWNSSRSPSFVQTVINSASCFYSDVRYFEEAIEEIPKSLYEAANGFFIHYFRFSDVERTLSPDYISRFLFSYSLKSLTMTELIQLVIVLYEVMSDGTKVTMNDFLDIVENCKTSEWIDYPIEWTVNMLVRKS